MNIGVVTVYDSMNYGSFLQAYALKIFLEDYGHRVFFLKWNTANNIAWNSVMKPIIFRKSVSIRGIEAGIGRIKSFYEIRDYFQKIKTLDNMDLVIVGSDTLWDVSRVNFRNKVLYGGIRENVPVISYAVSCSDSSVIDFNKYKDITENIKHFDCVTVRDRHTQDVLKESLDIDSQLVCDPTLLVDENVWEIYNLKIDLSNTILVYTYELSSEIINYIQRFSRENGLNLTSLCIYQPWCDYHLNCAPLEFPAYLKAAKYVVTNTFHGTIFSIISECNLISIRNGNKLKNLLCQFFDENISLEKKCTYDDFLEKTQQRIEYKEGKEKISLLRKESKELFENILERINIKTDLTN